MRFFGLAPAALFAAATLAAGSHIAAADKLPGAPRLLPEDTFLYFRIENVDEFRADLEESPLGQMMTDPKLRPFAGELYGTAADFFEQLSGELGVSLEQLLEIPQGQLAFGLVAAGTPQAAEAAPGGRRDESPEAIRRRIEERQQQRQQQSRLGLLVVVDTQGDSEPLERVLEEIEQRMTRGGAVARTESVRGTRVRRLVRPTGESRLEYFHRGGATVIGFGPDVATEALARWDGASGGKSLAEKSDFAAVMGRCVGASDTRPQTTFYFDPYRLLRSRMTGAGVGAAVAWSMLEELGISKIRGIGGSTFHGGETFAGITHVHVLIDPPRDGIFSVLRPKEGDTNPPSWVPEDITAYTSIGWRFDATYDGLGRILDRFQGDGSLERMFEEPFKTRIGGDLRESIIDLLDDRAVIIQWLQQPVKLNSSVMTYGLKVKDPAAATRTLDLLHEAFPQAIRIESMGTVRVYASSGGRRPVPAGLRQPEPCAVVLDDWVLFSDSREFIERAVRARDGALPRLNQLPDYDLLASELGAQLGGDKPFMLSFSRSAEVLRQIYELAKSDQTRSFLDTRGEQNPMVRRVAEMLRHSELPPFEEFQKYFAPTGSFAYDEPNGIHFGQYTLKPLP